ncbi:MAG: 2-amino-4-hydroxy-6-hydroxymethyldihydropteridine diphosphokinase [Deltaproteobacteria bacterium]|nr:2-amino-4-hydroxy-6-hydroxymethyldihydropteridine diphosphokinase [Deltaproteobacteria bacterium]
MTSSKSKMGEEPKIISKTPSPVKSVQKTNLSTKVTTTERPFLYLLALGSCVPPAEERMHDALAAIADHAFVDVYGRSKLLNNPAVGGVTAQPFVNAVIALASPLSPMNMLRVGFAFEQRFGRLRTQKNAARTLDVDVIWCSANVAPNADLQLPHPKAKEREFVTEPAAQAWTQACAQAPHLFQGAFPF